MHEETKISFNLCDDNLLDVYRGIHTAVDGFIFARVAGDGKLFFCERIFGRVDVDDIFLCVRSEHDFIRTFERQIRTATDFNFRGGDLYCCVICLRGGVEYLFLVGGKIFSSGRFGRDNHCRNNADKRLFSRASHEKNFGDNSSVGSNRADGCAFNRRNFVDVHRLARLVLSVDDSRSDKFIRGVFILRNTSRTQTLSRRNFKFIDAFNRNRTEKIFHGVADYVLNFIRAVHGIFERVEFHLRRIFQLDRAGIQLFLCSEFGGVNRGTDFVSQAERFNDERRNVETVLLRGNVERHFGFEFRTNAGDNFFDGIFTVHGDWRSRETVHNGNFVA